MAGSWCIRTTRPTDRVSKKTASIGDSEIAEIEYRARHAAANGVGCGPARGVQTATRTGGRRACWRARRTSPRRSAWRRPQAEQRAPREDVLEHQPYDRYLDTDFNYIRVNHAYAWLNGRDPEFYPGRNHFEVFMNPSHRATFHGVVETARPHYAFMDPIEYSPRPGEGVIYCDWSLLPVREADGRVGGLILSLVDVTEHRRAREENSDSTAARGAHRLAHADSKPSYQLGATSAQGEASAGTYARE